MPPSRNEDSHRPARRSFAASQRLGSAWHHSAAWVIGSALVGLVAVFLAIQSDYASKLNNFLFDTNPLAPLLIMPTGFAAIAFLSARYFAGTAGCVIPQTIAALYEPGVRKRHNLLSLHIAVGKVMLTLSSLTVDASVRREARPHRSVRNSPHKILPLMATAAVATGVSRLVCPAPLYQTLAEQFMEPVRDPNTFPGDDKKLHSR